jgi:hypothetical protein
VFFPRAQRPLPALSQFPIFLANATEECFATFTDCRAEECFNQICTSFVRMDYAMSVQWWDVVVRLSARQL